MQLLAKLYNVVLPLQQHYLQTHAFIGETVQCASAGEFLRTQEQCGSQFRSS
jgi:hypothetical protein